jgi:hypothetical protein
MATDTVNLAAALDDAAPVEEKPKKTRQSRKLPNPPKDGAEYEGAIEFDVEKFSLPAERLFKDPQNYWQSRRKYCENVISWCDKVLSGMEGTTFAQRVAARNEKIRKQNAVRALKSDAVKEQVAKDPSLITGLASNMSQEQIAALLEQLNAVAAQKAVD